MARLTVGLAKLRCGIPPTRRPASAATAGGANSDTSCISEAGTALRFCLAIVNASLARRNRSAGSALLVGNGTTSPATWASALSPPPTSNGTSAIVGEVGSSS